MNILLFAADDVGAEIAAVFRDSPGSVSCVVVDPSDPGGYNKSILAAIQDARYLVTDELDDPLTRDRLTTMSLDIAVAAWWPHIIAREVFGIPRLGTLNLHPSLLPEGRGRNPNFWALVENTGFGVTIHHVDEGIDTGDIAWQRALEVTWEDTGKSLHLRAKRELVALFEEKLGDILSGEIPRIPQRKGRPARRSRELDSASRIDLDKAYIARDLLNLLRARSYAPHPGARFAEGSRTYETRIVIEEVHDGR